MAHHDISPGSSSHLVPDLDFDEDFVGPYFQNYQQTSRPACPLRYTRSNCSPLDKIVGHRASQVLHVAQSHLDTAIGEKVTPVLASRCKVLYIYPPSAAKIDTLVHTIGSSTLEIPLTISVSSDERSGTFPVALAIYMST